MAKKKAAAKQAREAELRLERLRSDHGITEDFLANNSMLDPRGGMVVTLSPSFNKLLDDDAFGERILLALALDDTKAGLYLSILRWLTTGEGKNKAL